MLDDQNPKDTDNQSEDYIGAEEDVLSNAAEAHAAKDQDAFEQMNKQLNDTREQLMRALAETENQRKRAERDRQDASQYAITQFARDLLPVADNLARAIDQMEKGLTPEIAPLMEGVKITQNELLKAFEKHKIQQISPLNGPFDHNLHQAMFEVETDDHPAGTVVELLQPGYVLAERLLRPALVGVSKKKF